MVASIILVTGMKAGLHWRRRAPKVTTALCEQDASQQTAESETDSLEISKDGSGASNAEEAEAPAASDDGRYPERSSVTGGWYGGEVGLQQFIQVPASTLPKASSQICRT